MFFSKCAQVRRGFRRGVTPGLNRNLSGGVRDADEMGGAFLPVYLTPEAEQKSRRHVFRRFGERPGGRVVERGPPRG